MAASSLVVVSDYVNLARTLLQDSVAPYRYSDDDLVTNLNLAIFEARTRRPDLFLTVASLPQFTTNGSTAVSLDQQYRLPMVYFMCGLAQLRDEESTQDARSAVFMNRFTALLTGGGP